MGRPQAGRPWRGSPPLLLLVVVALGVAGGMAFARAGDVPWTRFVGAALRPSLASSDGGRVLWPDLLHALWQTAVFAVSGMSLALPLGFALGLVSADLWWRDSRSGGWRRLGRCLAVLARSAAAALRSVHELLWAMLWLAAWGLTPLSAVLAIALPYAGTLAKVFLELAEEAPRHTVIHLRESGQGRVGALVWGLLPALRDDFGSYSFYRLECALRSSAILGFFGFPTIGYSLALAFENLEYRQLWTYLYLLLGLAALMEFWSRRMRWSVRRWA